MHFRPISPVPAASSRQSVFQRVSVTASASPDNAMKAPRQSRAAAIAVSTGIPKVAANGPPL